LDAPVYKPSTRQAWAKMLQDAYAQRDEDVMRREILNASPQEMMDILTRRSLCFTDKVLNYLSTKLIHCAMSGDAWLKVAKMIVEVVGFKLIQRGRKMTAVINAAYISNINFLDFFLDTKLPWTRRDHIHCLLQACAHGSKETVEYLIRSGLCKIAGHSTRGTWLHYLIANIPKRNKEEQRYLARLVISDGADPNALGHGGYTPLYYALKCVLNDNFDIDMIKIFIQNGATWCDERHATNKNFLTSLTLSTFNDDLANLMISVCNEQQNAGIIEQHVATKHFHLTLFQMFAMSIYHEKILEMMFRQGFQLTARVVYELQIMPAMTCDTPMGKFAYKVDETRLTTYQHELVRFILEQSVNNIHKFTYCHPIFVEISDEIICNRNLAFCVGLHPRIGQHSWVLALDQELVREILKHT